MDEAEVRAMGLDPAGVLDFSVNVNPAPPPAALLEAMRRADVSRYPDSDSTELRAVAARHFGVPADWVVAGNGSTELIRLVCLAYIRPGDAVVVPSPTYSEYATSAVLHGAMVSAVEAWPGLRMPALVARLAETPARAAFICNPNNPTGSLISAEDLADLARRQPSTLIVVDEAYADFVAGRPTAIGLDMPNNLLVLRSLTKFAALPGLRLGLAVGQPVVIAALRRVKPPWNINAVAQAAGIYALAHPELLPDVGLVAREREQVAGGLRALGLRPLASVCNFFLVGVGRAASGVRWQLLERGVNVRDCASFGLPDYVRVAVRTGEENARLLEAFREVLAG